MSEDKDKIELKPDAKESGDKSDKKSGNKDDKKSPLSRKTKILFIVFAIFAVLIIAGIGLFLGYRSTDNTDNSSPEKELSYAEELEQYQVYEGANQDERNTHNLRLAWAYYREDNYERTLELLEQIQDPTDNVLSSYNELYGLTLSAMGRDDEAQKYNQITLEAREEKLLDSADKSPVSYYSLGVLYANAGQTDKAIESYKKYIAAIENASETGANYEGGEYLDLARQALEELQ